MRTHNLGRLFWHTVKLTGAPPVHVGKTSMTEQPYYRARPLIFRCYFGYGIVLGVWMKRRKLDVSRHLADALVVGTLRTDGLRDFRVITSEDQFYGAAPEREP